MAFKPPEKFSFHQPAGWPEWRDRFFRFRVASKLNKEDGEIQVSSLIYSMSSDAERVFSQFNLSEDEGKNYDSVLEKFNTHFVPQVNVIHERATFHKRSQREGESVEEYVRSLFELLEHAQFAEKEETIRDRLVLGLQDQELSQKLQLESDLTLDKAVTIARQHELVKTQIKEQRHGAAAAAVDSFSRGQHRFTRSGRPSRRAKSKHTGTGTCNTQSCTRCGTNHGTGNCPAKGQKCHKYQKFSHFARCCKTKTVSQVEADSQPQAQEAYFVDSVGGGSENPWRVTLGLCGRNVSFKIDTGADVNVVSKRTYDSFTRKPTLQRTNLVLHSPGGVMKVLGQFETATTKKFH